MLFDTHAHLGFYESPDEPSGVLRRARNAGVGLMVILGYGPDLIDGTVRLAEAHDGVFAAVGVHAHHAVLYDPPGAGTRVADALRRAAVSSKVVALGEIGLDYYRDLSPRPEQERAFREQLRLARELALPVVIHDRDAHEETLRILTEEEGVPGVMHCFSGDVALARRCLELGFYISIAGPVTFGNARDLPDVARFVPSERLVLETDSPYLSPHPLRGKGNEPANLPLVAARVAELRGITADALAELTTSNARALFGIEG